MLVTILSLNVMACPNNCNQNGYCFKNGAQDKCTCNKGYFGGDCSLRRCPYGKSWADMAIETDVAHQEAECSNMGICDRATGLCTCHEGFAGLACNRINCPLDCNGHGHCQSISYNALQKDPGEGTIFKYNDVWDHDMMYGCVCDKGYFGHDCLLRECPYGDDPLTGTVLDTGGVQYDEVQTVTCKATSGTFTLAFRQETTAPITFNELSTALAVKFNALTTVGYTTVEYAGITTTACTSLGNVISITFTQDFGDLPFIVPDSAGLSHSNVIEGVALTVAEFRKGTKENAFCSNRGVCDTASGVCTCSTNYDTSNGAAGQGNAQFNRGDCGFATASITACPGEVSCSSHGVCQGPPTYKCICSAGWQSADCSEMACQYAASWFDRPIADGTAHQSAECSNMGTCDRSKGACTCSTGFEGAACDTLSCPGNPACNGHGSCLTMNLLAQNAEINGDATAYTYGAIPNDRFTWDYNKVSGCKCDSGYTGYDCSLFTCPTGDDPLTRGGLFEIQQLICIGTTGSFSLKFRQFQTVNMPYSVTAATLKANLEALSSIGTVDVTYSSGTVACTATGSNVVLVKFKTELGLLPPITTILDGVTSIDVAGRGRGQSVGGTKENIECSGRGLCDTSTGKCKCFTGFGSSDGDGNEGTRGDCGFIEPIYAGSASEASNTS